VLCNKTKGVVFFLKHVSFLRRKIYWLIFCYFYPLQFSLNPLQVRFAWDLEYESNLSNLTSWTTQWWKPRDPVVISFHSVPLCDRQLCYSVTWPWVLALMVMSRCSIAEHDETVVDSSSYVCVCVCVCVLMH